MGSFHCKTSIIDESDKNEINLKEKSRNRNNMIDKDIIKIRNFNVNSTLNRKKYFIQKGKNLMIS